MVKILKVDIPDEVKPGDWVYVKVLLDSPTSTNVTLEVDAYLDGQKIIPTQEWTLVASSGQNWYTSPFAIIPPSEGELKVCVWQRYPAYQPDVQVCDTTTVLLVPLSIVRHELMYEGYPTPPFVGETKKVFYTVELNKRASKTTARLEVNGKPVASDSKTNSSYISISYPVTFTDRTEICGYIEANGLSDSKCITVTPRTPEPDIRVYDIKASDTHVFANEPVTITAYVHNFGKATGSATIDLYVNGKPQNMPKTVTLDPDKGTTVSWQISFASPGTYKVCAGEGGGNMPCITIVVEAPPEEVPEEVPEERPELPPWLPYAAVAGAIAAAYLITRKK